MIDASRAKGDLWERLLSPPLKGDLGGCLNPEPALTILIPTLNQTQLLKKCLHSLQSQTFNQFQTLVVDDGSTEDIGAFLQREFPKVRHLRLERNQGFAAAANAGIQSATTEYVFLLNNDITLETDCIERLMATLEAHPTLAAVGPLILCEDDPGLVYTAGDRIRLGGRPESIGHRQPRESLSSETPFGITAGAALYRRSVFEHIGDFDERFIAYYEDADWCFRARLAGYGFALVDTAVALHAGSASLGGRHLWRARRCYRNHALLVAKNMPARLLVKYAPQILRERLHQLRRLFGIARSERGLLFALRHSLNSWLGLMLQMPQTLLRRKRIQKNATASVQEIERLLQGNNRNHIYSFNETITNRDYLRFVSNETPSITIALLTRNAGRATERTLSALRAQQTVHAFEVVAVDSGSTDGTAERLEASGVRVIRIDPEEFNFGSTRDLTYQHARGEIVINLSQDAIPADEHWLENLIAPLNDPAVAVSTGRSIPDPHCSHGQFPWERNGRFYFTREMRRFARRHGRGVSFANSAVRRSVWERLRFDPQILGEDYQFQTKLESAGYATAFPQGAEVFHHHDYSIATLYRRCRDEGAALRMLGCAYSEIDLVADLSSPGLWVQWLREIRHGRLRSPAGFLFPWLRPVAVYAGSRFGAPKGAANTPREAMRHG